MLKSRPTLKIAARCVTILLHQNVDNKGPWKLPKVCWQAAGGSAMWEIFPSGTDTPIPRMSRAAYLLLEGLIHSEGAGRNEASARTWKSLDYRSEEDHGRGVLLFVHICWNIPVCSSYGAVVMNFGEDGRHQGMSSGGIAEVATILMRFSRSDGPGFDFRDGC